MFLVVLAYVSSFIPGLCFHEVPTKILFLAWSNCCELDDLQILQRDRRSWIEQGISEPGVDAPG
jgi:hypothetical protein